MLNSKQRMQKLESLMFWICSTKLYLNIITTFAVLWHVNSWTIKHKHTGQLPITNARICFEKKRKADDDFIPRSPQAV